MDARAEAKFIRISPPKVQIVCDLIRGRDAQTAMAILMATPKTASEPLAKLLKSACANAENNFSMDPEAVCFKGLRRARTHSQENAPGVQGQSLPYQQENLSHHPRGEREGISEEEVYGTEGQSPRSSRGRHQKTGILAGMQAMKKSVIFWSRTRRSATI